jgi:ubiquinone/menaquinone biosynthesis C-methylase UbiE
MTEQFYRDLAALTGPATVCVEERTADLNHWIMDQLHPRSGEMLLQIGGSHGQHALALASAAGEEGYLLAIDRSYRALTFLAQRSQEHGLEKRIRFLYLNFDDLAGHLHAEDFARALGTPALCAIRQPQAVFHAIHQALKAGGIFFFYGSSHKDLAELRLFAANLSDTSTPQERRELSFIEKIGLPYAREVFSQVDSVKFEMLIHFNSPDELYTGWHESIFYEETLDSAFRQAAVRHFQHHTSFETTQRLVGIKAMK